MRRRFPNLTQNIPMEKRDERKSPAVGLRNFSFLYYLFYVPESRILSGAGGGSPPSPSLIAGRRRPEGTRRRCRKIPSSRKARFGEGGGSLRGEETSFYAQAKRGFLPPQATHPPTAHHATNEQTKKALRAWSSEGLLSNLWQRPTFPHDVMQYHRRWRA